MNEGKSMENPRAFLYAVTRNMIIDWYRRIKAVSLESLYNEEEEREFEVADPRVTREMEISADAKRVLEVLEKLEPQYKEIMYLRFVEDLQPKEIGEMLGLNANSVSIRITRGIESMRKIMGFSKHTNG
jgi:RNA polymerase sigma-70 factor (ECF subfamily)